MTQFLRHELMPMIRPSLYLLALSFAPNEIRHMINVTKMKLDSATLNYPRVAMHIFEHDLKKREVLHIT